MRIITLFLLSMIGLPSVAQFQVCESPTTKYLQDVYFIDSDNGVAVGDSGIIIRTVDGGNDWDIVLNIDTVSFSRVRFFDSQNAIAIGSDVYISNDSGLNWTSKQKPDYYKDIEILNDSTCLVTGSNIGLIKSYDKGASWDTLIGEEPPRSIGLLSFVDEHIGYSIHSYGGGITDEILKTTDGGINWTEIDAESGLDNTIMEGFVFISEDIGFRGGWYSPHMMRTIDGGVNWSTVSYVDSSAQFHFYEQLYDFHIDKNQANTFYACGWYGKLFKSIDYGNSWKELTSPVSNTTSLYGIYFIDDFVGWAVGANGTILKTTNGGELVGTNDYDNEPDIIISPNPTYDVVNIDINDALKITSFQLINNQGQLIKTYPFTNSIDLSDLAQGIYYLKLITKEGKYTKKIVKK